MISSGSLFTLDYLEEAITPESARNDADLAEIGARIGKVFASFPTDRSPNEVQTEGDLIWPIQKALGWQFSLTQQNLTAKGRDDVPDGLLFLNDTAKTTADRDIEDWKQYELCGAVVEANFIYSRFPIVERQEMEAQGRDLALAYCNFLAAGRPDAEPQI